MSDKHACSARVAQTQTSNSITRGSKCFPVQEKCGCTLLLYTFRRPIRCACTPSLRTVKRGSFTADRTSSTDENDTRDMRCIALWLLRRRCLHTHKKELFRNSAMPFHRVQFGIRVVKGLTAAVRTRWRYPPPSEKKAPQVHRVHRCDVIFSPISSESLPFVPAIQPAVSSKNPPPPPRHP